MKIRNTPSSSWSIETAVPAAATCAPIAHDIYAEILKKENAPAPKILAEAN